MNNGDIWLNPQLFLVSLGLTADGGTVADFTDSEATELAESIKALRLSRNIREWFSHARTGQVKVNPYWPRGSTLAAACFFINEEGWLDAERFFAFEAGTGSTDPVGEEDWKGWVVRLPEILKEMEANAGVRALREAHDHMVTGRFPAWEESMRGVRTAAEKFFTGRAPRLLFSPRILFPVLADYVFIDEGMVTIAASPDEESILHETLHKVLAGHREILADFICRCGLEGFVRREKLAAWGYWKGDFLQAAVHAAEECFARGLSAALAGKPEERMREHASCGFLAVPFIASQARRLQPTDVLLGDFLRRTLEAYAGCEEKANLTIS